MSVVYQTPSVPVVLDQCIQDEKGNVYCPVDESKAPTQPATGMRYASDDNLIWPNPQQQQQQLQQQQQQQQQLQPQPQQQQQQQQQLQPQQQPQQQQQQQQQQIYNIPTSNVMQNLPVLTLHRSNSDSNLNQQYITRPQNIDKNPQQILTLEPVVPSRVQSEQYTNAVSGQYTLSQPAAMPPPVVSPHYHARRRPVNMKRAIGMALLMSCLCPPVGLCGLGAALRGRHLRYRNPTKANRYKMVSYTMSVLAVILIILGIVIIVLLAEKQYI